MRNWLAGKTLRAAKRTLLVFAFAVPVALIGAADMGSHTMTGAKKYVIEIRGFAFRPSALRVSAGDTVVWLNRDVVRHTATSVKRDWDTGSISAAGTGSFVVRGKGELGYLCTLHASMKGTLIVR